MCFRILLLSLFIFPLLGRSEELEVDWKVNYDEAWGAARISDIPLFIEFVRKNNRDCKRMERTFANEEVVEKFLNECILLRLDSDRKEAIHVINVYRIKGVGVPFMMLIGRDRKVKGTYGGYLSPRKFFETFDIPLKEAMKDRVKSPAETLRENKELAERCAKGRLYARAFKYYAELIKVARQAGAKTMIRETEEDIHKVENYGRLEILRAKKRLPKKEYREAIALLKRVEIEFKGRAAAGEAAKVLDSLKENKEAAAYLKITPAAKEGFEITKLPPLQGKPKLPAATADSETKPETKPKTTKKPKPGKKLIRLTLKDGTQLVGSIVARSGNQLYFRPRGGKARFIKQADIAKQEDAQ